MFSAMFHKPMMVHQFFKTSVRGLALITLATLTACGGGTENSTTPATSGTPATPGFVCSGTVKELFNAMQGTYDGVVDPAFLSGAGAALTAGQMYPVNISGADCSIRFTGNKEIKYVFAFGDTANTIPSNFVGFSPTQIIQNPGSLDLINVQYNISISTATNTVELERRIARNSAGSGIVDGDLHLFSLPGTNGFGGLHMKVATKRPLK